MNKVTNVETAKKLMSENFIRVDTRYDEFCINAINEFKNGHLFEEINFPDNQQKQVDKFGGEGKGDEYYIVFEYNFPNHEKFWIRFDGDHDSWTGVEWYVDASLTEPKEITTTVWV